MSKKVSKRDYNNKRFPRPIPTTIPLLHISNKYFTPLEVFQSIFDTLNHIYSIGFFNSKPIDVIFDTYTDFSFKILNPIDMCIIWDNGFYGKGILSRSEPTWQNRMKIKIDNSLKSNLFNTHNNNGYDDEIEIIKMNDKIFSEEITKQRRLLRDAWKREREAYFELEKNIKLKSINGEISNEDKTFLNAEKERLSKLKEDLTKGPHGVNPELPIGKINLSNTFKDKLNDNSLNETLRMEDFDLIIDSTNIRNIEYLELDPCETLFLLQMNIIKVKLNEKYIKFNELIKLLVENFGPIIINEYVVYYHYKTLGWCVKNGLKFSCDWVLYSRGPPFSHAEFSVKVINENDLEYNFLNDNLIDYSAISRVVSGVKKCLILCFVDGPIIESTEWFDMWNEFLNDGDPIKLLNNFIVNEVSWKRWAPSRTRM